MDQDQTHASDLEYGYTSTNYLALDRARDAFADELGDIPLGVAESRWVLFALATFDLPELEAVTGLLRKIRADGPL